MLYNQIQRFLWAATTVAVIYRTPCCRVAHYIVVYIQSVGSRVQRLTVIHQTSFDSFRQTLLSAPRDEEMRWFLNLMRLATTWGQVFSNTDCEDIEGEAWRRL